MGEQLVAVAVIRGPRGVLVGRRVDGVPAWAFVGGKVEPGEDPAGAVVREVAEETGLEVAVEGEIGRRQHLRTGRMMVYLACHPVGEEDPVAAPDELAQARWVHPVELDGLMPDLFGPVREHLAAT